ncbi:IS66 family insertion sequence element accessory protein TnpB [Paracoccus actinidiae]|uniref:IS66 family insertion sequence element accessory protein TnpB n=1 Tax=Paracoccus actinidiae TaxID=3064531 RepID=UPI0027D1FBAE|nr:IS66 family insertion sequence element accessory protein TnpB [Paracoccus sp. M09]
MRLCSALHKRKGIDGLALAVQEMFGLDPFCGAVFVFRSKRADRIKLLAWDAIWQSCDVLQSSGAGSGKPFVNLNANTCITLAFALRL